MPEGTPEDVDRAVEAARDGFERGRRCRWASAPRPAARSRPGSPRAAEEIAAADRLRGGHAARCWRRRSRPACPRWTSARCRRRSSRSPGRSRSATRWSCASRSASSARSRPGTTRCTRSPPRSRPRSPPAARSCSSRARWRRSTPSSWPRSSTSRRASRRRLQPASPASDPSSARRSRRTLTWTWSPSPARPGPGGASSELAAATVKRVALELGGKSANVDPRRRRPGAARSPTASATASSTRARPAAPSPACSCRARSWPRPRQIAAAAAEKSTIGDPLDRAHPARPAGLRRPARAGARLHPQGRGGGREAGRRRRRAAGGAGQGYFVRPTVFSEVTPDMTIAQEEIFGPGAVDHPLRRRGRGRPRSPTAPIYGLAGGVWSADPERAKSRRAADAHRPGARSTARPSTRPRPSAASSSRATAASWAATASRSSSRSSRSNCSREGGPRAALPQPCWRRKARILRAALPRGE